MDIWQWFFQFVSQVPRTSVSPWRVSRLAIAAERKTKCAAPKKLVQKGVACRPWLRVAD